MQLTGHSTQSGSFRKFLKYGLPMMVFMLAGTFGLKEFAELRVKKREESVRLLTAEEAKKYRKSSTAESLEDLYKGMKEGVEINEWENIRGPRIWEEETLKILPTYKKEET